MKINDIIKEKRIVQNLTQAQIATYLGVSTPSVNKWEKGVTYPDITLLPALARVLKTDLNTLLSFQENLSDQEIGVFVEQLSTMPHDTSLFDIYALAKEKIEQFPNCPSLLFNTAMVLNGIRVTKEDNDTAYEEYIISLYDRVMQSDDSMYALKAKEMLMHMYMQQKDYEKCEALLAQMPSQTTVNTKQLQIQLYLSKGEYAQARHAQEENILMAGNEIYQMLLKLLDIALKEGRIEDGEYIANAASECAKIFDQWEYNVYMPKFEYYTKSKQRIKCVKALLPMLKSLRKPWKVNASPLYRTIKTKEPTDFFATMETKIYQEVMESEETAFLKDDPAFVEYQKELEKEKFEDKNGK